MEKKTKKIKESISLVKRADDSAVKKALIQNGHSGRFSEKPNVVGKLQDEKEG